MKKNLLALSIAAVLAATSMVATAATPSSFYVGARGGYAHADWDNTPILSSADCSGYGLGIYGGYNFNEYFALELGYNYFDGFEVGATGYPELGTADLDFHGPEIAAKISYPFTDSFALFARGGLMYAFGDMGDVDSDKIAPLVGGGAEINFTPNFSMRIGYDRYFNVWDDSNYWDSGVDMDIDYAYLGFALSFGGAAPAPAPEPVTKTVTTSYSLDSNTLFAFDKSEITPEGDAAIDQIIADVQNGGMQNTQYNVIGHTDRLGAEDYNQRLSERRAMAVADALMAKGVPSTDIYAEGRGETEPVTGNKCDGLKKSDLIVCYGPDRRVDIHVTGNTTTTETVPAESL